MYKIIFFDLDGTLLNDKKEVLQESIDAIKKAKENGIEVAICSGRQKEFVKEYKELAKTGKYIICANGAEIYDCENYDEIFSCEIDKELVKDLYNIAEENGYLMRIDTPYARYVNKHECLRKYEVDMQEDINLFVNENKVIQITIATNEFEINKMIQDLKGIPYVHIVNKYFENNLWHINILNSSVSKGNAISGLCKYLKIDLKDAVAFGDDLNDISMMNTVGLGIAMENAVLKTKESAKLVIGENNNPTIAETIEKIINNDIF